jgi:protein-L-isoaspartate(D-aspartate) O-methyltransferase
MNVEQARFNMIEQQIRPWEVLDPDVLTLLAVMKREDFVPATVQRSLAFMDMMVPLREAGANGQCMLEPKVEARLLQELKLQRHEKVLEIGTGSGYMAALLSHRAQQVHTLELVPELVEMAKANLKRAGVMNVTVRQGDGVRGLVAEEPFDAIVLSGSVSAVPQSLLDQLKVGGRLVAIVGQQPMMRATLYTRTGESDFAERVLFDTVAPRLLNFGEPTRFSF